MDATKLCQIEIHTSQIDVCKNFYEKVFGWRISPAELHNYFVLEVPEDCPYGISIVPSHRSPNEPRSSGSQFVLYFKVENAKAIADLAVQHGGTKKFGPTKMPAYGEIWQITDPDGLRFGLFESQI